ncbi:uncharacterized protein LOC121726686 isoform X2 [Aricia agestis]|uniref:uncharacterized protein LOC121726686 isoform X2 n=1 Tax=Aricia agestis TaxID=91739 RepID=UPI001C203273|nr:uncharacterized protein LOC121726686 isoform X2 [Aricia agestis]
MQVYSSLSKMALVNLVLVLCFSYICRAVPDVEPGDPRAAVFIEGFSRITRGPPGGYAAIDPLYINYFGGSFATLQYKNYNNTVTGLSNCAAYDFVLSADGRVINFALDCPGYTLYSANEVTGYLLYKNMNGRGTLEIDYGRYIVRVYAVLTYVSDRYGNTYYRIGGFSLDIDVIGPINFNFMHLFNNNRIRNEEINELANSNWKRVAVFSREPVWYPIMNKILASLNNYLRTAPIQSL